MYIYSTCTDQGKERGRGEKKGIGREEGDRRKGVRAKRLQIIYFSCILLKKTISIINYNLTHITLSTLRGSNSCLVNILDLLPANRRLKEGEGEGENE